MKTQHFSSDAEVHALVMAFETASLAPSEFTHSAHIAVALAYLAEAPLPAATGRMRAALAYFTAQHGASGYHETLTLFWMRLLDHVAQARYATLPLWARINAAVERYGSMAPVWAHYSRDHLFGGTAREEWVAPDLAPLPFGKPTGNESTTEGAT
jgi:hypothetical protein